MTEQDRTGQVKIGQEIRKENEIWNNGKEMGEVKRLTATRINRNMKQSVMSNIVKSKKRGEEINGEDDRLTKFRERQELK